MASNSIGDTKDDAGGVGAVGEQSRIVRQEREFAVDSATRERLRDDLLTLDEAVDAQVAPTGADLSAIGLVQYRG